MGRKKTTHDSDSTGKGKSAKVYPPSPYRAMWLMAMFDLPVTDAAARKAYTKFRKELLKDGFLLLQFSVYGRYCASEDAADVHVQRVRRALPGEGQVRLMKITDHQFGKMLVFEGKKPTEPEDGPQQLELF